MIQKLTDIHTHLLPAVDDGAQSVEDALALLRLEKDSGVERVMLTPHFYPQKEALADFLTRREQAYAALRDRWEENTMPQLRLGAEVHYSPELVELDLEQLTLGQGRYLLLELPGNVLPACVLQVTEQLLRRGIIPILAHVERCIYFRYQPERLLSLIQAGALGQISAKALQSKKDRGFSEACIRNGLAHIIASDLHDDSGKGFRFSELAEEKYGELIRWSESFAKAVWDGEPVPPFGVSPLKRHIFGYR